jgi:hypothetical protein
VWDAAVVHILFDISRAKGGDSLEERVYAAEITGTYTASAPITGSAAVTEADDVSAAEGTHTPPPRTGSSEAAEAADTSSAEGTFTIPTFTGTAAASEGADDPDIAGTFVAGPLSGTVATVETADTSAAEGTWVNPTITGTVAVTEAADESAGEGTFAVPVYTGTSAAVEQADASSAEGTNSNYTPDDTGPKRQVGKRRAAELAKVNPEDIPRLIREAGFPAPIPGSNIWNRRAVEAWRNTRRRL